MSIGAATRPAAALGNAGESLMMAGRAAFALADMADQRNREKDLQWASEASTGFQRILNERRAADAREPRETAGDDFLVYADEQIKVFSDAAPSAKAREVFMRAAREDVTRGHAHALQLGETTRLESADTSNRTAVANIAESYRQGLTFGTADGAAQDIAVAVDRQFANIEARFGQTAPKFADALRAYVAEEIVFATAPTNPDYARQMVAKSPINEQTRASLTARIDAVEHNALAVERAAFEASWRLQLEAAKATGSKIADIPEAEFRARYKKNWQIEHAQFQTEREIQNKVVGKATELAPKNPDLAAAEIAAIARNGSLEEQIAVPALRRINDESRRLADTDPAQWQARFDPDIQEAFAMVSTLPPEAQSHMMPNVYRLMEYRQGFPAPDDPHPERFLGLSTTHVLTAEQADERKRKLNAAPLDEKLRMIDAMDSEFGDPELAAKAYSDMLELGKEPMSVPLRFTSIINDVNTQREFATAQINAKTLPALDEASKGEYSAALDGSKDWQHFQSAWMGDSGAERIQDATDARSAITTYAQYLTVSGKAKGVSDGIKLAVERVVSENYAFADVNGRTLAIARYRQRGGASRSDAEARDIARRLGVVMATLPPQEIQIQDPITGASYFPGLPPTFDIDKKEDAKLLRDFITSRGYWQMMPDGESAMLTVADPGRMGLKVLNKANEPIIVRFDDLPTFATSQWEQKRASYERLLGRPVSSKEVGIADRTPIPLTAEQVLSTGLPGIPVRRHRRFNLED